MAKIFISYRRRDSGYVTDSISEKLQQHFGADSVFYDIDTIPLGVDFREHIGTAVGQCDVLLAIIGEKWVAAADEQGHRRLDNPADSVRIEIESALNRKIPVIPVLVDEAQIPSASDLPESIQNIIYRNAAEVRAGSDFRQHVEKLLHGLERLFKSNEKTPVVERDSQDQKLEPPASNDIKNDPIIGQKAESKISEDRKSSVLSTDGKNVDNLMLKTANQHAPRDRILEIIQENFGTYSSVGLYIGTDIPRFRLVDAIMRFSLKISEKDILLVFDDYLIPTSRDTLRDDDKNRLVLTTKGVYYRTTLSVQEEFLYEQIQTVETKISTNTHKKPHLLLINGGKIKLKNSDVVMHLAQVIRRLVKSNSWRPF